MGVVTGCEDDDETLVEHVSNRRMKGRMEDPNRVTSDVAATKDERWDHALVTCRLLRPFIFDHNFLHISLMRLPRPGIWLSKSWAHVEMHASIRFWAS